MLPLMLWQGGRGQAAEPTRNGHDQQGVHLEGFGQ